MAPEMRVVSEVVRVVEEGFPVGECAVCGEAQFITATGPSCRNGHGGAPTADEARAAFAPPPAPTKPEKKRREASGAKKERAALAEAAVDAARARLDSALLAAEAAGTEVAVTAAEVGGDPAALAKVMEERRAAAMSAYASGFRIEDRATAAWAARKLAEAKWRSEDMKELLRSESHRLSAAYERREEFFSDKLRAWVKAQPVESGTVAAKRGDAVPSSVRLPEVGVRLELRDAVEGGVRVLDEDQLVEELHAELGTMGAAIEGLVRSTYHLDLDRVRAYIREHPELAARLKSAVVEPVVETKRLVVAKL